MFVVRPARKEDLADLESLAAAAGPGMTTLPEDEKYLRDRIEDSLRAFDPRISKPGGESYLFVLEDTDTGEVLGTAGIVSKVGGFEPFYTYRIRPEIHRSEALNVRTEINALHFTVNHNGPAEIGSLFLNPKRRRKGLARLLSLSRFLFMAEFPERFDRIVISELRGWMDEQGRSPFWDGIGRCFFETEFHTADFLSGTGQKSFIAELMPRYPVYIPLLPLPVQEAIGMVHRESEPALALLKKEGFAYNGEVDIFDGGPTVNVPLAEIRSVRQSQTALVGQGDGHPESKECIITNTRLDFRSSTGRVRLNSAGTVGVSEEIRLALNLKSGDPIRFVPLRGGHTPDERKSQT